MRNILIPITSLLFTFSGHAQVGVISHIDDSRPMARVAEQLQPLLGLPIHYEDLPLLFPGDLIDRTAEIMTPGQRASNPNVRIVQPKGGKMQLRTPQASALEELQVAIGQYRANKLSGDFHTITVSGALVVIPVSARDEKGQDVPVVTVLSRVPSRGSYSGSAQQVLKQILDDVSPTVKIGIGTIPFRAFMDTILVSTNNRSAREVLLELMERVGGGKLYYHLYFDPFVKYYMLNIREIPATATKNGSVDIPPTPAAIPASTRFFPIK